MVLAIFPEYKRIHGEVHVRITDLPIQDSLRDLRQHHLNSLIRVAGVVTRRTGVFPQLKYAKYDCGKCGAVLGPFFQGTTTGTALPPKPPSPSQPWTSFVICYCYCYCLFIYSFII